jgi:hypothetical protein
MKYRVAILFVTVAAGICVATAQSSQAQAATPKSKPDPMLAATKPLTPKSAMPAKSKSSVAAPTASQNAAKTNAELTHLERQPIKAGASDNSKAGAAKGASAPKPAGTANANGSGINFTYEKPKSGMQAAKPDAHAPNSTKPRVTKNN